MDVYRSTVDGEYVRYIRPQEFGNKTDVRWVALTDADGRGLLAVMPHLEVSAHHYRAVDLEAAAQHARAQAAPRDRAAPRRGAVGPGRGAVGRVCSRSELTARGYRYALRPRPLAAGDVPGELKGHRLVGARTVLRVGGVGSTRPLAFGRSLPCAAMTGFAIEIVGFTSPSAM